jgi:hypothetical protein
MYYSIYFFHKSDPPWRMTKEGIFYIYFLVYILSIIHYAVYSSFLILNCMYYIYFFIDRTTFGIITILHTYCICNPFHLLYTDVADGESIVGVSISQARSVASISTVVLHGQVLQVGVPTTAPCVRASHPIHVLRVDSISRSVAPDVYVEINGQPLYALSPAAYGQRSYIVDPEYVLVYVYIPSLSGSGSVPVYTTRDVYALCPAVSVTSADTV